ncbi:MAG: FAD-dependent oxidoreductase [Gammaproteobacteria bacterium]
MRVAIVGGGYAGFSLARALDRHADVTLIEAREAFFHNVAAMRAVVQPDLAPRIVIAYDRLLVHGRVLRARAARVSARQVELADGTAVAADVVVVATGSGYAAPFKPQAESAASMLEALDDLRRQLRQSAGVVIVGAGAVGVELAGEIRAAMPALPVSLISSTPVLFPRYPQTLHAALVGRLATAGVALHLGDAVEDLPQTSAPFKGEVRLRGGTALQGLIIPAVGARVTTGPAHALPGATRHANGQLAVDAWLRPSSLPNVFGIGDLIDTGEGMTIVALSRQVAWAARTLRAMARGRALESLPGYKPWPLPPILLPLGPKRGASVLPLSRAGTVVGDWLTSRLKGGTLFVSRYRREFGRRD